MLLKKNTGFTLIELIIVIVILGILAVIAVPKFLGIQDSARIAQLKSLSGAIKSGITIINAKAIIEGKDKADNEIIMIGGQSTPVRIELGYPIPLDENMKLFISDLDNWQVNPNNTRITTKFGEIMYGYDNFQCAVVYNAIAYKREPTVELKGDACSG